MTRWNTRRTHSFLLELSGLLVHCEPLGRSAMIALVRSYTHQQKPDLDRDMAGRRLAEGMETMGERYGLNLSLLELAEAFETPFIVTMAGQVTPPPEVQEGLAFGRESGLKPVLASNGRQRYVNAILGKAGLAGPLDAEVTGDDVVRGKPFPERFLRAARCLGVTPEQRASLALRAAAAPGLTVRSVGRVLG